jgi:hypothetical protein
LNLTAVTPVKFDPVIVTTVPARPIVGLNDEITGGPITKFVALVAVPDGVVTWILPDVAPVGTVAVMDVGEVTVTTVALVLLNRTCVAPQKFAPVTDTIVPATPEAGLNDEIVGAGAAVTVNADDAAGASPFPTTTLPVVAPQGTEVLSVVAPVIVNAAVTPLNVTEVTFGFWKFVPVIVTGVPGGPVLGLTFVMVGGAAYAGTARMRTASVPSAIAPAAVRNIGLLGREIKSDLLPVRGASLDGSVRAPVAITRTITRSVEPCRSRSDTNGRPRLYA